MSLILDAKPMIATRDALYHELVQVFVKKRGRKPRLDVVLVGDDPASAIYTGKKKKQALALGMHSEIHSFSQDQSPEVVKNLVRKLNQDLEVDGILIQRPLPKQFKEEEAVFWVDPIKDVDGFHPENIGRLSISLPTLAPCTPSGVMRLLDFYKIEIKGKLACVMGRSALVGKPMGVLLVQKDASVIGVHSRTPDFTALTRQADILVVATGKKHIVDAKCVKPGAVVVDVGIHRVETPEGKSTITGDVDFESVSKVASAITPVPGGVGLTTVSELLGNTLKAAFMRSELYDVNLIKELNQL